MALLNVESKTPQKSLTIIQSLHTFKMCKIIDTFPQRALRVLKRALHTFKRAICIHLPESSSQAPTMHIYIYTHRYIYIYICICIHIHIYFHSHEHPSQAPRKEAWRRVIMHVYIYTHTYTYVCIHIHAQIDVYIYIYIYMYIYMCVYEYHTVCCIVVQNPKCVNGKHKCVCGMLNLHNMQQAHLCLPFTH